MGAPAQRGQMQAVPCSAGGTTPGTDPRMSLRLKTDRGDIRVRAVHVAVMPPPPLKPARTLHLSSILAIAYIGFVGLAR